MSDKILLKHSGVDIKLGEYCSEIAQFETQKGTITNQFSSIIEFGTHFNAFDIDNIKLNNIIAVSSDGVGTKVEIAERVSIYNTIGFDLVAMISDDLVSNGYKTVSLTNVLDVDHLNPNIIKELMIGLKCATEFAGISVNGGEIAELGDRVGGYGTNMHFNWSGTGVGVLIPPLKKAVYGTDIKVGDKIVALKSAGFRSNGFSLLRSILKDNFGDSWHLQMFENRSWGEILLTPSLIYTPFITEIIKSGFIPKGIAHITGGGVISKLKRVLPRGLGANLDSLWEPFSFMNMILDIGSISKESAYQYWNMGNGMLLVCDEAVANSIVNYSKSSYVESKICGEVTDCKDIIIKYN